MKDILLDSDGDVKINNDGDFMVGDSTDQEIALILQANKGEWKAYPRLGANLIALVNSNISQTELQQRIRLELQRDGKDYDEIKNRLIQK